MTLLNPNDELVRAENLSKFYGSPVFSNISFSLARGGAMGVTGGNGSGKTTLLNIIAGLDKPSGGTITRKSAAGYVMQKAGIFDRLSCLDNMRYICALNSLNKKTASRRIEEYAELCGLNDFLRKKAGVCSVGMLKRLNIALALLPEPELLLLDEADAGLDYDSRKALKRILSWFMSGGKRSMIIVSHHKEEISGICPVVLNMENGLMSND